MIPIDFLRQCVRVEGDALIWLSRPDAHFETADDAFRWNQQFAGRLASGGINAHGYERFSVTYQGRVREIAFHRVLWAMAHGTVPPMLDHINGDRSDNRLANLRVVDHTTNMQNQRNAMRDNRTGFLGVSPSGGRYRATIRVSGKQKYLGLFDTAEAAHEAYLAAKRELHGGCTI